MKAFKRHQKTLRVQAREADLERMLDRSDLCHEAECLSADPAAAAALRERWQAVPALADAGDEQRMTERFEQALSAAAGNAATGDGTGRTASRETRESLCLRMEILAGVDSPPEHARARMAHQVNRLASAFGKQGAAGNDTPEELVRQWCLCGPAPAENASALESRFKLAHGAARAGSTSGRC